MKVVRYSVFFTACLMVASQVLAQQMPNGDFEEWTLVKGSGLYKDYEEPSGGVWSSGNGVIHVAAGTDPVAEKTTDAHHGSFAAKLTTRKIFGQIASGSLFTGSFSLNLAKPVESARLGVPFTAVPRSFHGWFKYLPAGGDSASLYVRLWRWNDTTKQRVLVAEAYVVKRTRTEEWTEFTVPFQVMEPGAVPDTAAMVFSSSAGGGNFKGDEGSVLFVDDVALSYESTSDVMPWEGSKDEGCIVRSNDGAITVTTDGGMIDRVFVTDLCGRILYDASQIPAGRMRVELPGSGTYVVVIERTTRTEHVRMSSYLIPSFR